MKLPPHSPFEASPRTSKNPSPNPELASSSSSPLRVTDAGSQHPVVRPRRSDPSWQAGDSASNQLRSSREDQHSVFNCPLEPLASPRNTFEDPLEAFISPRDLFEVTLASRVTPR
ncbi:hypothetical protein PISMIDRAFT_18647 [Pisolithus microcarpus 441]|uniref:Uncharacterized protein n=1 Tax=Pisolithus microcarpus 441 TaxID=765257 RepID=A0A0C9YQG2_9AGAM|nr:hypothetical protein BKA83DRAFT_18647 [Pisolithus microcarpus]KIK12587.1 hypothetical protein PISMIDRAFT_18647 [Pisolithus microcarpus 441]